MRIAVIGSGAMGSVFAALLSRAGHEVLVLVRRALHLEAARAGGGLRLEAEGRELAAPCTLTLDPQDLEACDLALVLVKSMDTESAASALASTLPPGRPVLTLQNGLGNREILRDSLPDNPVLAGVTTCAATLLAPGRSRLVSVGNTVIGGEGPEEEHAPLLAGLLAEAGLPAVAVDDPRPFLWEKLLVNIAVNPLTALTGLTNGQLAQAGFLLPIAGAAIAEGEAVAASQGVALAGNSFDRFLAVCEATADNLSSMAQDIAAGRPTEIGSMNGAVGRLGHRAGIPTPVNDMLTALVRGRELGGKRSG